MKPAKVLILSGLLLALCLSSLFALWRRANRIHSEEAAAPHIRWSYTPGSSPLSGIALASNGTVHFAAADGIYALSPEGQLLWKAPLPFGTVVAAPTLAPSGTLYAASQSGKLFALDTSGNLIWQSVSSQHKFLTPPALGDGDALYVTDDFSDLFAFAPSLGANVNWKHATYSAAGASDDILLGYNQYGEGSSRTSPVIGADGMIYLAHQSWLYQLNPRGEVLWFIQLPVVQLDFPAIGGDGTVYVEGRNPPWFFAIGRDGKQRWMARASSRIMGSPVIDNAGILYFCDSDLIKALMPDSRQIWYLFNPCNSGPALAADGTLYLGTNGPLTKNGPRQSFLSAVTPDGKLRWKIEIHGMIRDAPAIAPDGTIFFTTDQGYAYAVSDASFPPMDSPWPRFQHDAQNSGRSPFYR